MRNRKTALLFGFLALPLSASAQTLHTILSTYTDVFATFVNFGVGIALVVFIWGVVTFIAKSGDDKSIEEGKKRMVWGVVGLFVIVSVWGLVALLNQLVGVDSTPDCISPGFEIINGRIDGTRTCI